MPDARIYLDDFALENPMYSDAIVSVFTVDPVTQLKTPVLAALFDGLAGDTQLANPQALDGSGKWLQPVYAAGPVIMVVNSGSMPQHQTGIQRGPIVADEALLRAYGALLDGVHDDRPAFAGILADAIATPFSIFGLPTIIFELPAASILLSGPIDTGQINCIVRGVGPNVSMVGMASGGAGGWIHGTHDAPALGYLQLENFTLRDLGSAPNGSGSPPLSGYWRTAAQALGNGLTLKDMAFRGWGAGITIKNLPRGMHCENVVIFGPDYGLVPGGGFNVTSTTDNYITNPDSSVTVGGMFSYTFINVFVSNYTWGWHFDINLPLEGMTFYSCRAYNGWGFCQADAHAAKANPSDLTPYYRSVLWEFTSCDWQGLGFALDMRRCRNITIRGGFWIFDAPRSDVTAPITGRRRIFQFFSCSEIMIDAPELAAGPSVVDQVGFIYLDYDCSFAVLKNLYVINYAPNAYCGIEIGAIAAPNLIKEQGTQWCTWQSGAKILDASSQQAMETLVALPNVNGDGRGFYGSMDGYGRYELSGLTPTLFASSDRHVVVQFPTRPNGSPFFVGGLPAITISALNTTQAARVPSLLTVNTFGFVLAFDNTDGSIPAGYQVQISWKASGL